MIRLRDVNARARIWLLTRLPAGVLHRPFEWFTAVLCVLSGASIVTGAGESSSVERLLYQPLYYAWGGSLLLGGLALVCGLSSIRRAARDRRRDAYEVRRVACYKLGLRLLGRASAVYVVAVLVTAGLGGVVAATMTLAFAGTCAVRLLTIDVPRVAP